MKTKNKKHTVEDRLKYVKLLEEGYSTTYIRRRYGYDSTKLKTLWLKYQKYGVSGLVKKRNNNIDGAYREKVVRDVEDNYLTLPEASVKYDVSVTRIKAWKKLAREKGYNALYEHNKPGRQPNAMGRPKKKKPEEMTELELLKYENERLRAENALLKKVRALVEEREARLRGTGRKPSKN